jgi:hypothetical protein
MRLTADQVKQAILSDDRDVREAAVYYFARSYSDDPGIMPLAIQAIEQHGWKETFKAYSFIQNLVQTDDTVLWLIDQIKQIDQLEVGDDEVWNVESITNALVHADVKLLEPYASQIIDLDGLNEKTKDTVCQRVRFSTQRPEDLWNQLTDFCTESDKLNEVPDDLDIAYDIAEALSRHPDFAVHKILPILDGETGDEGKWIELFAVRIAGDLKLHKAIAQIIKLLKTDDDWIPEEGHWALVKIGGDRVVEELARAYPSGDFGLRLSAASIFENLHTDLSVQTSLRLYENEEDNDQLRGSLLRAALINVSTEAIEPARQFILATPLDPDVLDVRHDLLVACKVMGETFPEFEEWVEDSKNDMEFRRKWYRKNSSESQLLDYEDELDEEEEDVPLPPRNTIIRNVRVGRNDPCPCGSGKKFKKCCLGKGSEV